MKASARLALVGAIVGGVWLAALWWRLDLENARVERGAKTPPAATASAANVAWPAVPAPPPPDAADRAVTRSAAVAPADARVTSRASPDDALRKEMAQNAYAGLGGAIVDELVAHGLAQSDAERTVRRFFDGSASCFFEALRSEADARSIAYDSLLDALDAERHDADGAPLAALIDLTAVTVRAAPCGLTVAEQAGITPSMIAAAARDAVQR